MSQRKFKVKVIQISLKNNKLANAGETVTESQLQRNADELVKGRFIEEIDGKQSNKSNASEDDAAAKELFDKAYSEGTLDAKQLDSMTKAEIGEYADKHQLVYDGDVKKAPLIKQVLKGEKSK